MVSTIVPGAAGANALGVDHRYTRNPAAAPQARDTAIPADRVEVSSASLAVARESVREAMAQVRQALAIGQEAQAMLVNAQGLASGGEDAQAELTAMLADYSRRVEDAVSQGALLVTGKDVAILAEPGAAPIMASGVDLRLKEESMAGGVMLVSAAVQVDDPGFPQAVQGSLEALQSAMGRLLDVARSLEAHRGFIGAAEGAVAAGVRHDLDADGARLLALQVRQGLEAAGAQSIANAEPQAVLALFRA